MSAVPALADEAPPGDGASGAAAYSVVASGLDNPRGLALASNGDIYVAEAGHGGASPCIPNPDDPTVDTCFGDTGAISLIQDGAATQVVTGLPSLAPQVATQGGQLPPGAQATGPSDVIITGSGSVTVTIGLGADPAVRDSQLVPASPVAHLLGTLVESQAPGTAADVTVLADIAAFEGTDDPVPGPNGPDSNPNAVIADGSGYLVVDAGGNDIVTVDAAGTVTALATFPPSSTTCPPSPANPESVPTSVVRGPDGALYVSELTGFPFCEGGASIYRIADDGTPTVYAAGLTNVTGLAFGPDGTLYAVELAQHGLLNGPMGAVIAIPAGGGSTMADYQVLVDGILAPYGIAIDGDAAYVTMGSILPATAGGGSVIKLSLAPPAPEPSPSTSTETTTWSPLPGSTGDDATSSFGSAGTAAIVALLLAAGAALTMRRRRHLRGGHA